MANDTQIRTVIRQMLDKGDLLPQTAGELREFLEEIDSKGSLDPMDADYVLGLARRLGMKGKAKESGGTAAATPTAAANDGGASAGASIARARELAGMLYDPETGLNTEISDERASEILEELLQSLDNAESAISAR